MRENYNTCIDGTRLVLVPYKRAHVDKYHTWMKDVFLQESTASEPLTEAEEYEMQESWAVDPNKCTFIVLDRDYIECEGTETSSPHVEAMAGDVNLFLNDIDDPHAAEIEVMIAEERSRRKGIAKEAVRLMMMYAIERLGIRVFRAKVGDANNPSLQLFEKTLGFKRIAHSRVFQETTLEWIASHDRVEELKKDLGGGGGLSTRLYE